MVITAPSISFNLSGARWRQSHRAFAHLNLAPGADLRKSLKFRGMIPSSRPSTGAAQDLVVIPDGPEPHIGQVCYSADKLPSDGVRVERSKNIRQSAIGHGHR